MKASRTRFNRDQTILTTFDSGKLIPFYVDEVLPGDTFNVNTAAIIRMSTPKFPVMDDAFIDFYYFYCPNRILWDNFKQFMGEVEETPWAPRKDYKVPMIVVNGKKENPEPYEGSILDYMGVPTLIENVFKVNALPIRAYVKIWNEFFRDENVDNAAVIKTDDSNIDYQDGKENESDIDQILIKAIGGGRCLPVNKFHDYFTSCLPYPQRGPAVTLPMEGNATVYYGNHKTGKPYTVQSLIDDLGWAPQINNTASAKSNIWRAGGELTSLDTPARTIVTAQTTEVGGINLVADVSTVTAATINDLRKAVAVQQYYEALARGGSRYREQVQALWNVTISDKTVQIPEYLGGGRYHVNINQIVQTAENDKSPLGETGAMSVTPINESSFTKSFEEHGFIIGVCCVRHNRSYQQGLERFWSREDRLDYYVPQFANLGEQPVKKKEIMLTGTTTDEETFGYQEAWADYRMKPNRVSGLMRSNATGTLDFWHYADNYSTVPTLSQGWMGEGKTEIARTLVVQDEPQFFGAIRVANKTTRRMPLYSVPGLYKL
nr:MAG: major capsid protein [Microvirus sp.]